MLKLLLLLNLLVVCQSHVAKFQIDSFKHNFGFLSDAEINFINSLGTTWKAGRNFYPDEAKSVLRRLGVKRSQTITGARLPTKTGSMGLALPDDFDPRTKWPHCKSLSEVRDQSDCGSCWAFGAVEAMTDRYCIHSNGTNTPHISAEHLLSCCDQCGDGCNGGFPNEAWYYWTNDGIVTGGQYGSKEGCKPYSLPPCDHHVVGKLKPCPAVMYPTPPCPTSCIEGYQTSFQEDKHVGSSAYGVSGVTNIMEELYTNGPIEVSFTVYADFIHYKSGVYQHVTGGVLAGHAVKLIGWGVEKGTPYWLVVNSWNDDWGDKGLFKILRNKNECGIEDEAVTGMP